LKVDLQYCSYSKLWIYGLNLESVGRVDVIYTDLKKVFDRVPHKRLISKLYSYKINIDVIKWIESFILYKRQRVCVNGFFSYWQQVLSEIPQGSILGPLLFIIFINDLADRCTNGAELFLYADDSKLF